MSIPTKEELETPRSAGNFLPWVEERLLKLGKTKDGKTALRLGHGLAKQLTEEAYAVGIFASVHFQKSPDVTIRYVVGNQSYDAAVTDNRLQKSPVEYVEVTQAHEGRNFHLRMLYLEEHRHVSPIGEVTEHEGRISVESQAISKKENLDTALQRIFKAAGRKAAKRYPDNTALVVAFEDSVGIHDVRDEQEVDKFVQDNVIPLVGGFRWFALVGWKRRIFFEYDLSNVRST